MFVISTVQIAHRYLYLTLRQQSSQKEQCSNRLQYSREALLSFKSTQRNMKGHEMSLSKCQMHETSVMSRGHCFMNKILNLKHSLPPHNYETVYKYLIHRSVKYSVRTHYSMCICNDLKKNTEQCNEVTFVEWLPMLAVINR